MNAYDIHEGNKWTHLHQCQELSIRIKQDKKNTYTHIHMLSCFLCCMLALKVIIGQCCKKKAK